MTGFSSPVSWLLPSLSATTGVTFRYRAIDGTVQRVTLRGSGFVRCFLQHVLPKGFQRVRHYGWRGAAVKAKRERILALLDYRPPRVLRPVPVPRQNDVPARHPAGRPDGLVGGRESSSGRPSAITARLR